MRVWKEIALGQAKPTRPPRSRCRDTAICVAVGSDQRTLLPLSQVNFSRPKQICIACFAHTNTAPAPPGPLARYAKLWQEYTIRFIDSMLLSAQRKDKLAVTA